MHPTIYMLEKELLEHKIVTRLPLFLLLFSVLISVLLVATYNTNIELNLHIINTTTDENMFKFQQGFSASIAFLTAIVSYMLSILYLGKTLRKELQEGSLAFWRSMPVSDLLTHLVKLAFALLVIPVICSILVLSGELLLWSVAMINPHHINQLIGNISLFSVLKNYLYFLFDMFFVSAALLPFACIILAVSQMVNSPLLVVFIAFYALKILATVAFPNTGLEQFFYQFIDLPIQIIKDIGNVDMINNFVQFNTLLMYLLGALFLMLSLSIRKHGEFSIKNLFKG